MSKNFINFHVLISHSPSCLNRDDMNMQKTAIFGGKRRVRISSQSLKRTMRKSDYFSINLGKPSNRTRELSKYYNYLNKKLSIQFPDEMVEQAIAFLADKRDVTKEGSQADAVAPWCEKEVEWVCNQLQSNKKFNEQCKKFLSIKGNSENDKKKKRSIITAAYKELDKNGQLSGLSNAIESAVDIALYGRMAASGLMETIDGALAVAHAITTHSVESDIDWFTAVDDLQEQGSGHLDTQEFSSGVFYRYASLNCAQLQENLGGCDREKALKIASHVLHLLATETPSAKQQSFAAHNPADMALISFSDMPISLANAFESPVQPDTRGGGGYRASSIKALQKYWDSIHKGYGLEEHCAEFCIEDVEIPEDIQPKSTLGDLKSWICNDGKDS